MPYFLFHSCFLALDQLPAVIKLTLNLNYCSGKRPSLKPGFSDFLIVLNSDRTVAEPKTAGSKEDSRCSDVQCTTQINRKTQLSSLEENISDFIHGPEEIRVEVVNQ